MVTVVYNRIDDIRLLISIGIVFIYGNWIYLLKISIN